MRSFRVSALVCDAAFPKDIRPDSQSVAEARPVSRPHCARRVRGRRALTPASEPRLTIQLSGGCQILVLRTGLRPQVEPLLDADSPRLSTNDIAIYRRLGR